VRASPRRLRREHLVLTAIWLLGLAALASVLMLQSRLDQRRQAQFTVASLQKQISMLPKLALGLNGNPSRDEVQAELGAAEQQIAETAGRLDGLAGNRTDSRVILSETRLLFPLLARANAIARSGHLRIATVTLGLLLLPGQPGYQLNATFDTILERYGHEASDARRLADIGSTLAIVLLLVAFSLTLWRASRLAREKHILLEQSRRDALTDELTGLANRRSLFADLDELLAQPLEERAVLGVLDLDGFKAYNDEFGHPAGDALLARMGGALCTAVDGNGVAYRLGGDEFCVIARGPDADRVLELARAVLSVRMAGVFITCSLGAACIGEDGSTADGLIHTADERLYRDKRSSRGDRETQPALSVAR
jgi:diguanylate cyclase (GGDEF)-like protein